MYMHGDHKTQMSLRSFKITKKHLLNETNKIFYTTIGLCMTHNNVILFEQKKKGGGVKGTF